MALKKRNQVYFDGGVLDGTPFCTDGLQEPDESEALPTLEEYDEFCAMEENSSFGANHRQPLKTQIISKMEDCTIKYKVGKHPNSLANLKRGGFKSKEAQMRSSRKGVERKRAIKTMREVAQEILLEDEVYLIEDEQGNEIQVTLPRLEVIVRKFIDDCMETPTPQKMLTLRKMLGEEETTLTIQDVPRERYADIDLPKEEKERLAMLIMNKAKEK